MHDTYQDNTIDLRGTNPGNVALDLTGDHFGTRVLNNTFLGSNAISISADPDRGGLLGDEPTGLGLDSLADIRGRDRRQHLPGCRPVAERQPQPVR